MKSSTKFAVLLSIAMCGVSGPLHADETACRNLAMVANATEKAHQSNTSIIDTLNIIDKTSTDPDLTKLLRAVVSKVYAGPIYNSDDLKKQTENETEAWWYNACMKSINGN
jgi:predicted small lipoprotein YifL